MSALAHSVHGRAAAARAVGWRVAGFAAVVVAATTVFVLTIRLVFADGPHPLWQVPERFLPVARLMLTIALPGFVVALVLVETRHWLRLWTHVMLGILIGIATAVTFLAILTYDLRLGAGAVEAVLLAVLVGGLVGAGGGAGYWLVAVWLRGRLAGAGGPDEP